MIEPDYRHVLYRDLKSLLRRDDYLGGFTLTEQAYIRKNINAASADDLNSILGKERKVKYDELSVLLQTKSLVTGSVYLIEDFLTIYLSKEKNEEGKYISYGLTIHPSKVYTIAAIAIASDKLLSRVSIISDDPNSIFWDVKYDATSETLDDGTKTKGKITYLLDNNFNQAQYDFKNILIEYNSNLYYTFSKSDKTDNSINCFNNNLCFANNIILIGNCSNNCIYGNDIFFNTPVNNLIGELNNVIIELDEIGLDNETIKQSILSDNKYYIDYLDLETLTHLFYALAVNIYSTLL